MSLQRKSYNIWFWWVTLKTAKFTNIYNTYWQASIVVHVGVWLFDGFPTLMIAVGIATQLSYSILLRTFPFISMASPAFLLGCGELHRTLLLYIIHICIPALLLLHHYLTFTYFTENLFTFQEVCVCFIQLCSPLDLDTGFCFFCTRFVDGTICLLCVTISWW